MRKRIAYSQNFLVSKTLISKLIKKSSITREDVVYEIGSGQGVITEELLKKSRVVVAFEIDRNLFSNLTHRFQNEESLELKPGNFLTYPLPTQPYKVFSNIPFNLTSAIIRKLTQAENPPDDTYLVVQKEAAEKFIGKPYDSKNSLMAILLKPWFDFEISYQFKRSDFFPKPNVDTILLRTTKKIEPSVSYGHKRQYQDFITYAFNQFKPNIAEGLAKLFNKKIMVKLASQSNFSSSSKPGELDFNNWIGLFNYFLNKLDNKHQSIVRGSHTKLSEQQKKLEKIHRTRTDKGWKGFKE